MTLPRWFMIASCFFLLNLGMVLSSVVWRYATADEMTNQGRSIAGQSQQPVLAATGADVKNQNPLERLAIPDSLPEVPSLADPEAIRDDPIFQEFQRMFSGHSQDWSAASPPGGAGELLPEKAYIEAFELRMELAEQLCRVTRRLAAESSRLASEHKSEPSKRVLRMAIQLREMSAQLLITEL